MAWGTSGLNTFLIISNVLLWLLVIGLGFTIYALTRQIGILYERVAPAGALMVNQALKVGDPAPEVKSVALDGSSLTLGGPNLAEAADRGQLLFFLAPDCPICKSLLPILKSMRRSGEVEVDIILASDGDNLEEHRDYVANQQLQDFPYVVSEVLGKSYGVSKLPYAVLLRADATIASLGIVNSREHLESLFEAEALGVDSIQTYLAQRETADTSPKTSNDKSQYFDATAGEKSEKVI